MYFNRVDELPDSVETAECKPDKSCNENPSSTPMRVNGKVPINWSSEGISSGFQIIFEGPLVREGSRSASNDLCARAEANAEDMYQLELWPDGPSPATESAFWRKIARDLSTTSFDYKVGKRHPRKSTWIEAPTKDESTTLEVDVACGVSPSGCVVCQPPHLATIDH